jgi:hypothetical protein
MGFALWKDADPGIAEVRGCKGEAGWTVGLDLRRISTLN